MKFLFLLTSFIFLSQNIWATQIESVFPTGSVKQVQQITVKFSADMIALGDPRSQKDPMSLKCNLKTVKNSSETGSPTKKPTSKNLEFKTPAFTTRWADTKTWSLDFNKALGSGIKCTLSLNSIKDLVGTEVNGLNEYSFSTAGPAILGVAPYYGDIEPEQHFLILVDGPLDTNSVQKLAYFEVSGLPDKVGVKIVEGSARENVIKASVKSEWRWHEYKELLALKKTIADIPEFKNFILIKATRRFPEKAQVVLHWPEGILSQSGLPSEEAQHYDFQVIPLFEANFNCERTSADRPCNPILNMRLNFTARVPLAKLEGVRLVAKNGAIWEPIELNGAINTGGKRKTGMRVIRNFADEQVDSLSFAAPFPESTNFELILPKSVKDDLGRTLNNADNFPLKISTDEYSPLIKFAAPFGLLEANADPALPVSLRNVEKQIPSVQKTILGKTFNISGANKEAEVIDWYLRVLKKSDDYDLRGTPLLTTNEGEKIEIKKPLEQRDFEVLGIPLKKPGFYVVELESPKLGEFLLSTGTMYVASAALVTNLSVHLKKGRESSLIWVTYLDSGNPVKSADVSIFDRYGKQLIKGQTDAEGIFRTGEVNYPCGFKLQTNKNGLSDDEGVYPSCDVFAFAKKGEDFSFVSSTWEKGIEDYRFNLSREYLAPRWGPALAHTILNRNLLQAGDTIKMKHILREHSITGFRALNPQVLPQKVLLVHQGSQKTYTLPFVFDKKTGTALNEFTLPKDIQLGTYAIYLSNKKTAVKKETHEDPFDWDAKPTVTFTVSEYRLPLMSAHIKIQGENLVRPSKVNVDLSANYLSGGPAKKLGLKLRSTITDGNFAPQIPGDSNFNFFSNPVKVGVRDADSNNNGSEDDKDLNVQDLKLSEDGGLLAVISKIPEIKRIKTLVVEMEYRDPNGEIKTASAQKNLFPADFFIGVQSESWMSEPGKFAVNGVITNTEGKLIAGRNYIINAYKSTYITHRKKIVGGFYAYDSKTEITALGKVCEGTSDNQGRFDCKALKLPAGEIILQAEVKDEKSRSTYANVRMSVFAEGEETWWAPSDSDRIDILPEKNRYEPGEVAKFVVRSPFPKSTVLVTIEREGVIDAFVREISRNKPIIEVPIKGSYAPNVFISVVALRGRASEPNPTHLVDLAKPALKLGMAELRVGWKAHELKVQVQPQKLKYKAREIAEVKIKVQTASGQTLPEGAEVVVAAVDVGLLKLKNNTSWNILEAMMGQRELAVGTSSSQIEVIGKRHFGAKAKPPGGGGGTSGGEPRELFDPILLWEPRLKLNAQGEATIKVPLNDSITSFRIEAVAQAGLNLFGDAHTDIESSKDLIIYSGFAPQVRDGDQIQNALTVRNTTAAAMKIKFQVSSPQLKTLPGLADIDLAPSEAKTLYLPVIVPSITQATAQIENLEFRLQANDQFSQAKDFLKFSVKVDPAVPARVLAATLFQLDKETKIPVKQPVDAIANSGGLWIEGKDSLTAALASVKAYMFDYDNTCLEQKISKAIVLENKTEIQKLLLGLPTYFDSSGLLKFFPSSLCGSPQLTQYVIKILLANSYVIPETSKERMIAGLQAYLDGHYNCRSWWDEFVQNKYQDQERLLYMEALSKLDRFRVTDTSSLQLTPNLWKTEAVAAWFNLLKKETAIPKRDEYLKQTENILRSRVNYQGSIMNLQGDLEWEAAWKLFSSRDQEALGVFAIAIDENSWSQEVGKLARGLVARLKRGVWDTTMANAWGATQLRRFSAKFEKETVSGTSTIGSNVATIDWSKNPHGTAKILAWPNTSQQNEVPLNFSHTGTGKPWILLQTRSAIPLKSPMDMGYSIGRKVTAVFRKTPDKWSSGDVLNVELTVQAKTDQAWVVIKDPIPAGASHLGNDLDGNSAILDRTPQKPTNPTGVNPWPTEFEEKSLSFYKSYAGYLLKGSYQLSYRIRLNSAGEFKLPPSRVEAMYASEIFGESPNAPLTVVQ
jgi:uncharacterized protein YfaS (alpha-2-macroglobulin family)